MFKRALIIISCIVCSYNIKAQVEESDSTQTEVKNDVRVAIGKDAENSNFQPIDSVEDAVKILKPKENKKVIPARAALYSMLVPGLGQAYNGKYWKIPIIYSTLGFMYFMSADSHRRYVDYKTAYRYLGTGKQPSWVTVNHEKDYLKRRMDFYKRQRDLNIIFGVIGYLLNILDANVDAHLMDFDVSEDLSLHVEPELNYLRSDNFLENNSTFGLKFVITLNR